MHSTLLAAPRQGGTLSLIGLAAVCMLPLASFLSPGCSAARSIVDADAASARRAADAFVQATREATDAAVGVVEAIEQAREVIAAPTISESTEPAGSDSKSENPVNAAITIGAILTSIAGTAAAMRKFWKLADHAYDQGRDDRESDAAALISSARIHDAEAVRAAMENRP